MGEYLKNYCTTLGVTYISDDVKDVALDERGFISALELKERGTHPVEFVIDCSGFRSIILQKAMGEGFIPYGDHLLCDRALAVQIPHREGAPLERALYYQYRSRCRLVLERTTLFSAGNWLCFFQSISNRRRSH